MSTGHIMSVTGTIELGLIVGESSEVYHATDAVSHSKLETFRKRPALYHRKHVLKVIEREESPAFAIGSALHCAVLESADYAKRFAVAPVCDRRTTVGKTAWGAFVAENAGKEFLDAEQGALVQRMFQGVRANRTACELLENGRPELTWRGQPNTLPFLTQCRTDWFNEAGCTVSGGRPYVADVKTLDNKSGNLAREFAIAAKKWGYGRQAGFYVPLLQGCGVDVQDFFFIAVEKQEPFGCEVYRLSNDKLLLGLNQTETDLLNLAECVTSGVWPNGREGVNEIDWFEREDAAA